MTIKTRTLTAVALAVAVAIGITAIGCSNEREPTTSVTRVTEPTDVIDEALMLALGQAKNFHRKAKVYMSDGNLADATASVRKILSLRFPAGAAEADDVRADARALLAKLLVGQGQLEEAMTIVAEGLAQSTRDSFFIANLHTVQGEIHAARALQFEAEGDAGKTKAADERRAAIAAYDRSIAINERLQQQLMEQR